MWYMVAQHWWLLLIALCVGIGIGWWYCQPQET